MVRTYKRKRQEPFPSEENLRRALAAVLSENIPIRTASQQFGLKKSTLGDYVKKFKAVGRPPLQSESVKRLEHARQIIPTALEIELATYLKTCSLMSHGLTPTETRGLAFQFAKSNRITTPESWETNARASEDWFALFLKRHPTLSIRAPEATSQARASGFNAPVVGHFFDNLMEILTKFNIQPGRIWNADETGIPTVLAPPNVVSTKGLKQVQQTVSAERGVNTTMIAFVSSSGSHCPPVYIFPRKNFLLSMSRDGPTGCLGLAHPTGWVNCETFLLAIQHFKKYVGCSTDQPVLLLLDNHSSHLDYKVIEFAKSNGIHLLTFPPHCSHRLQPLDVSVFGPFKSALKTSFNDWLQLNPGKRITIHDVARLSRLPYTQAFTPSNITAGFAKSGISPFNRNIFPEDAFLPSFTTDRPSAQTYPAAQIGAQTTAETSIQPRISPVVDGVTSPHHLTSVAQPNISRGSDSVILPNILRPFPQIDQISSEGARRRRTPGRTRILTSTPEKNAIEEASLKRVKKGPVLRSSDKRALKPVRRSLNENIRPITKRIQDKDHVLNENPPSQSNRIPFSMTTRSGRLPKTRLRPDL